MASFLKRLFRRSADPMVPSREWVVLETRVSEALSGSDGFGSAAPKLLEAIGTAFRWKFGAAWLPDAKGERLRAAALWTAPGFEAREFANDAFERSFAPGAALVGSVWKTGRLVVADDVSTLDRAQVAGSVGLRGAFAFPILHEDRCLGVIEFWDVAPVSLPETLAGWMTTLGRSVGRFAATRATFRRQSAREAELAEFVSSAPVGIHSTDADGRILLANDAELDLLGYAREEYVGRRVEEFHCDPATARDLVERLRNGEAIRGLEVRVRRKDGAERWLQVYANGLFHGDRFVRSRVFSRDFTAIHREREEVAAKERRFRTLVDTVPDHAMIAVDAQGCVRAWTASAERLFGWTETQAAGKDLDATFPREDRTGGLPLRLVKIATDEGHVRQEGWRVRRDGSRFWAEAVYSALRDESGALEEVMVLVRDLSERRRAEDLRRRGEEIETENRVILGQDRGQVEALRGVSEAVRGPMAALSQSAERIRSAARSGAAPEGADAEAVLAGAGMMRVALDRMVEIASGAGRPLPLFPVPVDALRLAMEVRDILHGPATERRIRIDVDVETDLGGLVTDPVRLRQVVYNLLANGIRSSRERGRVALRISAEGPEEFRVEVEDSGIGMAPEALKNAWLPRRSGADGSADGNALAATRMLVEQQGGRVGARSSPGRGSTFFAVLPRALAVEAARASPVVEESPRRRVLVVTGDVATRASLSWTLGNGGHEVVAAGQAQEAIDAVREKRCDVVAVDLLLKGTSAVEFAALLRREPAARRPICLLACVGAGSAGVAVAAVADLLPRPAPTETLFATLERYGVPRGRAKPVLVVDADLAVLQATAHAVEALGYRAVAEPDGDAALRSAAEETPAAVIVAPFALGLDGFSFLRHLRGRPGARSLPVLLTVPATPTDEDTRRLLEMAGAVPGAEAGAASRVLEDVEAACSVASPSR